MPFLHHHNGLTPPQQAQPPASLADADYKHAIAIRVGYLVYVGYIFIIYAWRRFMLRSKF